MKKAQRKILMDIGSLQETVILAGIRMSNREISGKTGLSDGQITYRLHAVKVGSGMSHTIRQGWNLSNPIVQRVLSDYRGVMELDFRRKFLAKVVHPTPEIVKEPKRKPLTVDDAVKKLKASKAVWV